MLRCIVVIGVQWNVPCVCVVDWNVSREPTLTPSSFCSRRNTRLVGCSYHWWLWWWWGGGGGGNYFVVRITTFTCQCRSYIDSLTAHWGDDARLNNVFSCRHNIVTTWRPPNNALALYIVANNRQRTEHCCIARLAVCFFWTRTSASQVWNNQINGCKAATENACRLTGRYNVCMCDNILSSTSRWWFH